MKTKLNLIFVFLVFLYSCQTDPYYLPDGTDEGAGEEVQDTIPYDFGSMKNGDKLPIHYSENKGRTFLGEYNAVRIGEYLWMNSNFTVPVEPGHNVTQDQINKGLSIYGINTSQYKLTPNDINKYIGQYYSRDRLEYMEYNGNMYEGDEKVNRGKWGLPSTAAFRQLFAMCGNASEYTVRTTLCYKPNEIPIAKIQPNIVWITNENTNKYGFNLIYGGQRAHVNNYPWGTLDSNGEYVSILSNQGDFVIFYTTATFPTSEAGSVVIHDYPDTAQGKGWSWHTIRWCRKLTDKELGYKLYVNSDRSDIKKLGLNDVPPSGYAELPKGYLRGFYIQYILDNPNPTMTVTQLRQMELNIAEIKHGSISPT